MISRVVRARVSCCETLDNSHTPSPSASPRYQLRGSCEKFLPALASGPPALRLTCLVPAESSEICWRYGLASSWSPSETGRSRSANTLSCPLPPCLRRSRDSQLRRGRHLSSCRRPEHQDAARVCMCELSACSASPALKLSHPLLLLIDHPRETPISRYIAGQST